MSRERQDPPAYQTCSVHCACGNTFTTRSTLPKINVDICSQCHPFFTGKQKFVDTAGRVERFSKKFGGTYSFQKAPGATPRGCPGRGRRDEVISPQSCPGGATGTAVAKQPTPLLRRAPVNTRTAALVFLQTRMAARMGRKWQKILCTLLIGAGGGRLSRRAVCRRAESPSPRVRTLPQTTG